MCLQTKRNRCFVMERRYSRNNAFAKRLIGSSTSMKLLKLAVKICEPEREVSPLSL